MLAPDATSVGGMLLDIVKRSNSSHSRREPAATCRTRAPLCPKRTERFDLPPPSPLSPFSVRAKEHKLAMENPALITKAASTASPYCNGREHSATETRLYRRNHG